MKKITTHMVHGDLTLFDAWRIANYPLPPFYFFVSPEFEYETNINVVIIERPPFIPVNFLDVRFYSDDESNPIDPSYPIHSFHVKHERVYQFEGLNL